MFWATEGAEENWKIPPLLEINCYNSEPCVPICIIAQSVSDSLTIIGCRVYNYPSLTILFSVLDALVMSCQRWLCSPVDFSIYNSVYRLLP